MMTFFLLVGCASSPEEQRRELASSYESPEYEYKTNAHPATYSMDAFAIKKAMPNRSKAQDIDFFFKHCTGSMNRTYYSKTSYTCESP